MLDHTVNFADAQKKPTEKQMLIALGTYFKTHHVRNIFERAAFVYCGDRAASAEIERGVRRYFTAYHKKGELPFYIPAVYAKIFVESSGN